MTFFSQGYKDSNLEMTESESVRTPSMPVAISTISELYHRLIDL